MDLTSKKSNETLEKFRYELKIPLEQSQFIEFKQYLRQLGLHPVSPYPGRRINSVYFDSHDLNDYVDNVSGIAERQKTRIRWYNEDLSHLTLEFKRKKNKASYKELLKLDNPKQHNPRTREGVRSIMQTQKSSIENFLLQSLDPVIEVQYDREYFLLGADLRMTLDTDQNFRKLYPFPGQNMKRSPVYCVAEFKFPAVKLSIMKTMMRNLPFRVFRHSKYVIGMDVIAP